MVSFRPVTPQLLEGLASALSEGGLLLPADDDFSVYGRDETEDLEFLPEAVVRPRSTEEVSAVLRLCHEHNVPVTPRGGGTGLSGGALPVCGGVVLSVERMDRILEIDTENLFAIVQPGVVTQVLQEEVEKVGLFYPPDPASRGSCRIGGNVAEGAGGPRAVKYGVTKDYVTGVEAVLADGTVFRHGGKLVKNASGYNLSQLLVGSEGTLAVVTEVTLRLIPWPAVRRTLLVPFDSVGEAARCLNRIFLDRIVPAAAELLERDAVEAAEMHLGRKFPHSGAAAYLLIEADGHVTGEVETQAERIGQVCIEAGAIDVVLADSAAKQQDLWELRRAIGEAVKSISIYKEEDTVVPRARIPELMEAIQGVARRHGLRIIAYGHAGDGNIHANILRERMDTQAWERTLPVAIREIFEAVRDLGGQVSGEHGIGWTQRDYADITTSAAQRELWRRIKVAFDPSGILNPGKIFS